jgi:hypothetical protein
MRLVEILQRIEPGNATLENLLALIECLPERDEDYTPQSGKNGEPRWQQEAGARFGFNITRSLSHRADSDVAFYGRCKRALIVSDWIAGEPTTDIEARYSSNAFSRVGHGDIRGFADGSRFLFDSALRIAAIVLGRAHDQEAAALLLTRLDLGLPADALPLSSVSFPLTRGEILSLYRAGHRDKDTILALTAAQLTAIIGRRGDALYQALQLVPERGA